MNHITIVLLWKSLCREYRERGLANGTLDITAMLVMYEHCEDEMPANPDLVGMRMLTRYKALKREKKLTQITEDDLLALVAAGKDYGAQT